MSAEIPLQLGRKLAAVAVGVGLVVGAEAGLADRLVEPLPQEYIDAVYSRTHDGSKGNPVREAESDESKTQADADYLKIAGTNQDNARLFGIMLYGGLALVGVGATTIYTAQRNRREQATVQGSDSQVTVDAE